MRYQISKTFEFSASHILSGLPEGHQCGRLHGHNYIVKVILESDELDAVGFVVDYGELKPIKEWIDNNFDHRHLNDHLAFNPTAENMAEFLFREFKPLFPALAEIAISETPKTWARYRSE